MLKTRFIFTSSAIALGALLSSCTPPPQNNPYPGQTATSNPGVYNDPSNPYAVPGVTTQGGGYAATPQQPAVNPSPNYQPIPTAPTTTVPPLYPSTPSTTPVSPSSPSIGGTTHTVSSGESLWGLSRKYGVSVDEIRSANGISGDLIRTGQVLSIPR